MHNSNGIRKINVFLNAVEDVVNRDRESGKEGERERERENENYKAHKRRMNKQQDRELYFDMHTGR